MDFLAHSLNFSFFFPQWFTSRLLWWCACVYYKLIYPINFLRIQMKWMNIHHSFIAMYGNKKKTDDCRLIDEFLTKHCDRPASVMFWSSSSNTQTHPEINFKICFDQQRKFSLKILSHSNWIQGFLFHFFVVTLKI